MNESELEFGEERLMELVKSNLNASAVEIRERLLKGIENFVSSASQHDDLTMVIVRFQ